MGPRIKASADVVETRVSPGLAAVYIYPCIHMQIPIDMTTFTYCIFALGHILARQFPIVGFRPPVRLIDIIGRAADTRLHFYLHTFATSLIPRDRFFPIPLFFPTRDRYLLRFVSVEPAMAEEDDFRITDTAILILRFIFLSI